MLKWQAKMLNSKRQSKSLRDSMQTWQIRIASLPLSLKMNRPGQRSWVG